MLSSLRQHHALALIAELSADLAAAALVATTGSLLRRHRRGDAAGS
ncbi:hypothetical protein [Streptomyces sp. NPDC101132]